MKSNTVKLAFVAAVQFCALIFRKKTRVLSVALCALGIGLPASAQTYAIFDPPGAVVTGPQDINPAGTIAGTFSDSSGAFHGFLRLPDGTITTFDVAGAVSTGGNRINPAGSISGIYIDGSGIGHGFVRDPDGTFITYDAPGLGSTILNPPGISINPAGTVTGTYSDAAGVRHGFVRTADGTITAFDGPGAAVGTGRSWGTYPHGIDPAGVVTGFYTLNSVNHGFVRTPDGTIRTIDCPEANFSAPNWINPGGAITGGCNTPAAPQGFVRTRDGTFTLFGVPGAVHAVAPVVINAPGAVTGWYWDANFTYHGFLRANDGTTTTFDAPLAGPGSFEGTIPLGMNPAGVITGSTGIFHDANPVQHGFVRNP